MFTLDDIFPSKWHERLLSITSWLQGDSQFYDIIIVIKQLHSHLKGCLKEWYISLGEYRKLQVQQSPLIDALIQILYAEFIGCPKNHQELAREDSFK